MALEATRQSPATRDWLRALGAQIHLTDSERLSVLGRLERAKTDGKDAQWMLQLLIRQYLPEVYLAPPEVCEKRELYSAHGNLRQTATKFHHLLRTCLNKADLDLTVSDLLGVHAQPQVEACFAQMPPALAPAARAYWAALQAVAAQAAEIDQQSKVQVKVDPVGAQLL